MLKKSTRPSRKARHSRGGGNPGNLINYIFSTVVRLSLN